MDHEARKCVDCGGQMCPIQVVYKQAEHPKTSGLEFAAIDAQRNFWGAFQKTGKVDSYLCQDCGAVRLFAVKSK